MEKLGNTRVILSVDIISTPDNSIMENYSKNELHRTIPEGFDLCRR